MSQARILVDTGPLVALLSRNDSAHAWARDQFGAHPAPFFTCEAVLSECCFLLRRNGLDASAVLAPPNTCCSDAPGSNRFRRGAARVEGRAAIGVSSAISASSSRCARNAPCNDAASRRKGGTLRTSAPARRSIGARESGLPLTWCRS